MGEFAENVSGVEKQGVDTAAVKSASLYTQHCSRSQTELEIRCVSAKLSADDNAIVGSGLKETGM